MLEIKMKNTFEFCWVFQTQYHFICKAGVCRTPILVSQPLVKTTRCNYQKLSLSYIQTQKSSQGAKAWKRCGMGPCLTASWQVTWPHTMERPLFQTVIHWYSFRNWSFYHFSNCLKKQLMYTHVFSLILYIYAFIWLVNCYDLLLYSHYQ